MSNIYSVPQNFSTTLNVGGGITSGATAGIVLTSVTGLPTDGGILAFDWANPIDTTTIEYIEYTGISGNTLTGVIRGAEGVSAKAHVNGCTVVGVLSQAHIKRLKDNFTVEHDRSAGTHTQVTSITNNTAVQQKDLGGTNRALINLNSNNVTELGVAGTSAINDVYLTDSGSANAYAVTCVPAPVAYATGLRVKFKATNANTTTSTLNVNALGTKTIKRYGTTDLSANDIQVGQLVEVQYDGTNFLIISPSFAGAASINFATSGPQGSVSVTAASATDITGATVTINPTGSAKVHAVISGDFLLATASTGPTIQLVIDGVTIQTISANPNFTTNAMPFTVSGQATVSSGARVIKLQATSDGNGAHGITINHANVNVIWS